MAENTFEDRLTKLEEQFQALQALTLRLAAWELGGTGTSELDATKSPARATASERPSNGGSSTSGPRLNP